MRVRHCGRAVRWRGRCGYRCGCRRCSRWLRLRWLRLRLRLRLNRRGSIRYLRRRRRLRWYRWLSWSLCRSRRLILPRLSLSLSSSLHLLCLPRHRHPHIILNQRRHQRHILLLHPLQLRPIHPLPTPVPLHSRNLPQNRIRLAHDHPPLEHLLFFGTTGLSAFLLFHCRSDLRDTLTVLGVDLLTSGGLEGLDLLWVYVVGCDRGGGGGRGLRAGAGHGRGSGDGVRHG